MLSIFKSKKTLHSHTDEQGFVIFGFITIIPLLILIFFSTHLLVHLLNERQIQNTCRDRLLDIQKDSAHGIQGLLALNPKVLLLKTRIAQARLRLAAASASGNAVLAAAITAEITFLQSEQIRLRTQQLAILKRGQLKANRAVQVLRNELIQFGNVRLKNSATGQYSIRVQPQVPHIWALDEQDKPFPIYVLNRDFKNQQSIHLDWSWTLSSKNGAEKWIPWKSEKNLICGATLVQKAGFFDPRIHEVKFSSKPY